MLQEMMAQHSLEPKPPGSSLTAISTSSVDPFLSQPGSALESHHRQNSADSGVGQYPVTPAVNAGGHDESLLQV